MLYLMGVHITIRQEGIREGEREPKPQHAVFILEPNRTGSTPRSEEVQYGSGIYNIPPFRWDIVFSTRSEIQALSWADLPS